MRTRALPCAGALALVLTLAPPASAATVELKSRTEAGIKGPDYTVTTVVVQAAAGETNAISASMPATGKLLLTDPAAPLTAAAGCTQTAPATVECPLPNEISATLGDGNDVFSADAALTSAARLVGGPGDDRLTGGAGGDSLSGGGGHDVLIGGPGADSLADDDGAAPDADVLDGGAGNDSITFEDRRVGMTLDLAAGTSSEGDTVRGFETIRLGPGPNIVTGSAAGEFMTARSGANQIDGGAGNDAIYADGELRGGDGNDTLGCESIAGCTLDGGAGNDDLQAGTGDDLLDGGPGNDELTGIGGDDVLDGGSGNDKLLGDFAEGVPGSGNDTLRGGPGADHVYGGPGKDRLDAGPGADLVLSLDYSKDTISCGAGIDRLLRDKRDPARPTSCERVRLGATLALESEIEVLGSGADAEVAVDTSCPEYALGSCRGVIDVRDLGGRLLGRRTYRTTASGTTYIPLTAAGRRALGTGRHTIVVRARGGDASGGTATVARTYRVTVG
jgi:Ca2+-binding RTX toxin-like protein